MGKKGKANKKKGNTKTATAAAGDENIAVTSKKALFEEPKKASPTTLKESVMQNTAAEEKKKEAPKTEAKEEIKAEETQTELKEEPQTERKEDSHSSIDDWFAKQRRQLVTITEQPKAAAQVQRLVQPIACTQHGSSWCSGCSRSSQADRRVGFFLPAN